MLSKCLLLLLVSSFIEADFSDFSLYKPCGPPKPLEHGKVRRQRSRLAKFVCATRYELVGDRYATCKAGKWDTPTPVCVRPGCDDLPLSPNSIRVKEHRDAWVVTFCLPGYRLIGASAVYCDGTKWNATAPKCIGSIETQPLSCNFEDPGICGWTQDELHDFDWRRWNMKTPSSFILTGPSYDHTYGEEQTGFYMYIESTSRDVNDTARLLSPVYPYSLTTNGCFSFFYHMFGKDIGGLRVYQKPNSIGITELLNLTGSNRKYLLFEQWGNKGDVWYGDVSQLVPMDEDFQIVIEGIRGASFISDIAIDDVSILQGDNCTSARLEANSPPPPTPPELAQSCVGRCDQDTEDPNLCGCTMECLLNRNCCPDFIFKCFKTEDPVSFSTDTLPETQKLIGETNSTTPIISLKTTVKTTTITTPTTIAKPTTARKTTPKPTTAKPTTAKPTTVKPTTAKPTTAKSTTVKPTTAKSTTVKPTTAKPTTAKPTTVKPTTAKPTTVKATTVTATTVKVTTEKALTTQKVVTPVPQNRTNYSEIEMKKEKTEINLNKIGTHSPQYQSKSSTWKTATITVVLIALFVTIAYGVVVARTARGRQAIARLRGRATNDPEVRYLNSADDDDL